MSYDKKKRASKIMNKIIKKQINCIAFNFLKLGIELNK